MSAMCQTVEWFDVVDANDKVVGRETRDHVHRTGLLHRAVHILVFDNSDRIFLQMRSAQKDQHPSKWGTSAAGHLDAGEEYDSAAYREFHEELGIAAPDLERLFKLPASSDTGFEFIWIYRCWCDGPFTLNPAESDYGKWYQKDELASNLEESPGQFTPSFRLVWQEYQGLGFSRS